MTQSARIVADSTIGKNRLTTVETDYPRFIHSELMTHRVFSRNAASSRAIPVTKMIESIRRDPAKPMVWTLGGHGMQGHGTMSPEGSAACEKLWLKGLSQTLTIVGQMMKLKEVPHKQHVNRLLEPWAHIKVLITSNQWDNFFALRRHSDAQPEIHDVADEIYKAMQGSTPAPLRPGMWHLPYIQQFELEAAMMNSGWSVGDPTEIPDAVRNLIKVSVARSARTSYKSFSGKVSSFEEDLSLFDKLLGSDLVHASPAEHQATPDKRHHLVDDEGGVQSHYSNPKLHGNLPGWVQFRKTLANENVSNYVPKDAADAVG